MEADTLAYDGEGEAFAQWQVLPPPARPPSAPARLHVAVPETQMYEEEVAPTLQYEMPPPARPSSPCKPVATEVEPTLDYDMPPPKAARTSSPRRQIVVPPSAMAVETQVDWELASPGDLQIAGDVLTIPPTLQYDTAPDGAQSAEPASASMTASAATAQAATVGPQEARVLGSHLPANAGSAVRKRLWKKQPRPLAYSARAAQVGPGPAVQAAKRSGTLLRRGSPLTPCGLPAAGSAVPNPVLGRLGVLGRQAVIRGDGWGAGQGQYIATVTEADDRTYTVVRKLAAKKFEEKVVLQEHCALLPPSSLPAKLQKK
mmetsp:Transcript_50156/g.112896  ORF Transcript_50156/g.112896 Transcript_50156/m.112896 type:complete len:316 (+) Transcript_50156:52-999(+)